MARVEIPITVLNSATGLPVNGAAVAVTHRSTGAPATWWSAETGGTSSTAAVITDANGRVTAWVERGAYNLAVTGTGIVAYTESWDAAPGGNETVDSDWISSVALIPGEIKMYGGSSAPSGWLVCDGSLVSRTTYSKLFGAIGTTWGAGDGSTTFKLPDLRGRSPVGAGTGSGLTARTVAQTGGAETHQLTTTEIPSHAHKVSQASSGHNAGVVQLSSNDGAGTALPTTFTDSAGGGGAHPNMHPFAVVTFIIKV